MMTVAPPRSGSSAADAHGKRKQPELRVRNGVTQEFLEEVKKAARLDGRTVGDFVIVAVRNRIERYILPRFANGESGSPPRKERGRGRSRGESKRRSPSGPSRWPAGLRSDDLEVQRKAAHEAWVEIIKTPDEQRPAALFDLAKHLPDSARHRRWHQGMVLDLVAGISSAEIERLPLPIEREDGELDPAGLERCLEANTWGRVDREELRQLLACHYEENRHA